MKLSTAVVSTSVFALSASAGLIPTTGRPAQAQVAATPPASPIKSPLRARQDSVSTPACSPTPPAGRRRTRRSEQSRRLDKPLPDDLDDTGLLPWRRALFAKPPPSLAEDEPKPVDPMVRLGLAAANHRVRRSTDALFSTPGTNATGVPGFVEVAYPLAYSNLAKTVAGLVYSINSDRNDTGFDLGTSPSQSTQFWLSPAGNASDSDSASQNTFELKVPIVDAASLVASEYCATFPVGPEGEMSLQPCGETDGYSQLFSYDESSGQVEPLYTVDDPDSDCSDDDPAATTTDTAAAADAPTAPARLAATNATTVPVVVNNATFLYYNRTQESMMVQTSTANRTAGSVFATLPFDNTTSSDASKTTTGNDGRPVVFYFIPAQSFFADSASASSATDDPSTDAASSTDTSSTDTSVPTAIQADALTSTDSTPCPTTSLSSLPAPSPLEQADATSSSSSSTSDAPAATSVMQAIVAPSPTPIPASSTSSAQEAPQTVPAQRRRR